MPGASGVTEACSLRGAEADVLSRRLLSSVIGISLLLLFLWGDYRLTANTGHVGLIVVAVIAVVGLWSGEELRRLLAARVQLPGPLLWGTLGLVLATSCAPVGWQDYPAHCPWGRLGWLGLAYALALGLPCLWAIARYQPGAGQLQQVVHIFFVCGYVLLLTFICQLRFGLPNAWGIVAIVSLLVPVKLSDSFAYLIGKAWGRRKMSPQLSPGKTVEGGLAALVFGSLGGLLVLYPLAYACTGEFATRHWGVALLFGLAVTVAGICGDLAESLIKRELGQKDSGGLIPGMGGILDMVDSVLVAAPVVYAFWASGLVGPIGGGG